MFLFAHKSQVPGLLKNFLSYVTTQFNTSVKMLRSDNDTEFTNHDITSFLASHGILHQTSCVKTPQQNGRAERKHQHLLNIARALKFQSHLPNSFWGDFILTAAHIINLLPAQPIQFKTPFELLYDKPPSYDHLRSFGCLCYATNIYSSADKLSPSLSKVFF